MVNQKNRNSIVAKLWGNKKSTTDRYGSGFHWVESPIVKGYINKNITGNSDLDWVTYVFNKYLKKSQSSLSCLSLGSGVGNLERHLCKLGSYKSFDAIDLADGALKQARISAKELGFDINYMKGDLNEISLPKDNYDVIFANMSLHHVEELELLLSEISNSLKNKGLFIINEFVGPSQFQYTKKQVKIINEILGLLPKKYRSRVTNSLELKPEFIPSSIEYMNENDPSEAIRSEEIVDMVKERFNVVEHKDYGGTLLHMLLQDIVGNFDSNNLKDSTVLNLILYIERILIREGVIKSDFSFLVLRKRSGFIESFINRLK